jgi:glycosyltransferase involved in cell wall biosynthesis
MFLHECLESVSSQTKPPLEVIVVNDGSTCVKTKQALGKLATNQKVSIINHSVAQGLPAARNSGILRAEGEYILPLDADDKIAPKYIELATEILSRYPDAGIVCGDGEYFGVRKGKTLLPQFSEWRMLVDNCIVSTAMFRKADWEATGGYCLDFREGWEDWDFYLSLLERGRRYHHLDGTVYYYRRHDANMTGRLDKNPQIKAKLYRLLMKRHEAFFKKHSGEAMLFLAEERARHRAFSRQPLVAFCRKLLRLLGKY